jgi:prepilin-type N-terminal cleavage/methylation domain-containing protein
MKRKVELKRKAREEGFTLMELLVVVVIIGIISALAVPLISAQQRNAADSEVRNEVRSLVSELNLQQIRAHHGRFNETLSLHKTASDDVSLKLGLQITYDVNKNPVFSTSPPDWRSWYVLGTNTMDNNYIYFYSSRTRAYEERDYR